MDVCIISGFCNWVSCRRSHAIWLDMIERMSTVGWRLGPIGSIRLISGNQPHSVPLSIVKYQLTGSYYSYLYISTRHNGA
jgi:hypothetical protein